MTNNLALIEIVPQTQEFKTIENQFIVRSRLG